MTQETSLPSPPADNTISPPQYNDEKASRPSHFSEEKEQHSSKPCTTHSTTTTPFLDAHLRSPAAQSAVHTVNTTLDDLVDSEHCTRCTANDAARTLTRYLFEMKQAKKAGNWSKEDKKAAKVELKGLMREVKGVVREEKAKLKREGWKA